jgi:hypothetical protein
MRIVSWNKQSVKFHPVEFAEMLRAADADVVVLQETSDNPTAAGWTFVSIHGLGHEDHYAIGVREGGAIKYSMMFPDPRQKAKNPRSWGVARVTVGGETITIATCHAPHIGGKHTNSSEDTIEYMNALSDSLGTSFERPDWYVHTTKRKEKREDPQRNPHKDPRKAVLVDLFIGIRTSMNPRPPGATTGCRRVGGPRTSGARRGIGRATAAVRLSIASRSVRAARHSRIKRLRAAGSKRLTRRWAAHKTTLRRIS